MAYSPRKDEIEAVAKAIEKEKSLEAVAKAALKAAWKVLQGRVYYVVATDARQLIGPFESDSAAYSALAGGKVDGFDPGDEDIKGTLKEKGIPTLGGKAAVLRMTAPGLLAENIEAMDREARLAGDKHCLSCEHPLALHGLTARPCSVDGCDCKRARRE